MFASGFINAVIYINQYNVSFNLAIIDCLQIVLIGYHIVFQFYFSKMPGTKRENENAVHEGETDFKKVCFLTFIYIQYILEAQNPRFFSYVMI